MTKADVVSTGGSNPSIVTKQFLDETNVTACAKPQGADAEIRRTLRRYHDAMIAADIVALDALLDHQFALVHLNGYVQPKAEWLHVIATGEFDYHRITVDPRSLSVVVTGTTAVANGRGVFDATIHDVRRPWRLQFSMYLAESYDAWIVRRAQYSTF